MVSIWSSLLFPRHWLLKLRRGEGRESFDEPGLYKVLYQNCPHLSLRAEMRQLVCGEGKEAELIHGLSIRLFTLWTAKAGSFWPRKSHVGCSAPLIIHWVTGEGGIYSPASIMHCSRIVPWVVIHTGFQTAVSATVSEKPWGGTGEMAGTLGRRGGQTGSMHVPHVQLRA